MGLIVAASSMMAVWYVRRLALEKGILDRPNERSSHTVAVPRLGGAAFIPVILVAVAIGWSCADGISAVRFALLVGCCLLFIISIIDDFISLPVAVRFALQGVACATVLVSFVIGGGVEVTQPTVKIVGFVLLIWGVGMVNVFNFMDGIDGLAGLQALIAGIGWAIIASLTGCHSTAFFGTLIAAGVAGFLAFNWPPAKIFMGDAGSTVLGFSFAWFPLLVWEEERGRELAELFVIGGLLVWPFLVDGGFTIARRLRRGENLLKAHRSHIYQRLVIAGKSHCYVTVIYGVMAFIGGGLAWCVYSRVQFAVFGSCLVVAALFLGLWRWTVRAECRANT